MAFTLEHVKTLLECILVSQLRNAQSVISGRLNKSPLPTQRKLYEFLTVAKTVKREILFERDATDLINNAVVLGDKSVSLSKLYVLLNY